MKSRFLRGALILGAAVSALAVSCEMSTGLLSSSERSSLYSLAVSAQGASPISNGAVLAPGSSLSVSVGKRSGASELGILDFSLLNADGSSASAIRFIAGSADVSKAKPAADTAIARKISQIDGQLDGFSIPDDQAPGLYKLDVSVIGADGSVLQEETLSIFVMSAAPAIDSASVYPPAIEPGGAAMLSLSVSWTQLSSSGGSGDGSTPDPWIKWSRNGSVFAEGPLSAGFSKAVWTAPRAEGAYAIKAEVFPIAPAKGGSYSFKAAASQDLRVMIIAASGGSGDDFADSQAFYSLLKLDGSFDDSGTRPGAGKCTPFGSPALEAYPGGFGYRFGASAGVTVPGLMPPSASGRLAAFAVLVRLSPDQDGGGSIVRFASADSSYVLDLGIVRGKPYVESKVAGAALRSVAASTIPPGPLTLEAVLRPEGESLSVSWRAEGERIDAPSIPLPSAPPAGNAILGGALSLPGVYDGFGLMAPGSSSSPFPSPTFRLASRRLWTSSLVIAEGFEDGVMPLSASASGSAAVTPRGLELEIGVAGDRGSCLIEFLDEDGNRAFALRGTGELLGPSGKALAYLPSADGKLSFGLGRRDSKTCAIESKGSLVCLVPGSAARYAISFVHDGGASTAIVNRVLVRAESPSSAGR